VDVRQPLHRLLSPQSLHSSFSFSSLLLIILGLLVLLSSRYQFSSPPFPSLYPFSRTLCYLSFGRMRYFSFENRNKSFTLLFQFHALSILTEFGVKGKPGIVACLYTHPRYRLLLYTDIMFCPFLLCSLKVSWLGTPNLFPATILDALGSLHVGVQFDPKKIILNLSSKCMLKDSLWA